MYTYMMRIFTLEDYITMKYVAPAAELVSVETVEIIASSTCPTYNPSCPTDMGEEEMS